MEGLDSNPGFSVDPLLYRSTRPSPVHRPPLPGAAGEAVTCDTPASATTTWESQPLVLAVTHLDLCRARSLYHDYPHFTGQGPEVQVIFVLGGTAQKWLNNHDREAHAGQNGGDQLPGPEMLVWLMFGPITYLYKVLYKSP